MVNKMKSINYRKHVVEIIFILAVVGMIFVLGFSSRVYATVEYWCLNVDGKTVAVLNSESNAQAAIDTIEEKYKTNGAEDAEIQIDPAITIEKKAYKVNSDAPEILDVSQAVDKILTGNDGGSYVDVTAVYTITEEESVAFGTQYQETSELASGTTKTQQEGTPGVDLVTKKVTAVNGTVTAQEEISRETKTAPVDRIILKGTKATATASSSSTGSTAVAVAPGTATGANVANFAKQFVGNPYVYGGESLTNGCDCSGFTMAIFANYGISLPHGAIAQRSYGVSVGNNIANAQPGDLMCFAGHVGIYIGDGKMVHASEPRTGIIITPVGYSGKVVDIRRLV